jgi:hypothetical protein
MDRISSVLPDARLIVSLRNPTERAWSHYWMMRTRGRESRRFETAFSSEAAALAADPEAPGVFYLSHSLYDRHLERLDRLYPRHRVHISIFERMVADPVSTYRSLTRFLGVDQSFVPPNLGEPVNAFARFRSVRARRIGRRLPGMAGRIVGRLNTRRDAVRPVLDAATRQRLDEYFAPHVRRVEERLEVEIPEWPSSASSSAAGAT